jgi:flagellar basal-body rod protein FlgG
MSYGLYAAVAGSMVQERRMEVLSNNLANVGTAGFKEDRPVFKELFPKYPTGTEITDIDSMQSWMVEQKIVNVGYQTLSGIVTDYTMGEIKYTGNPLDVAINGSGFFVVTTPQGDLYTRDGSFSLNEKSELITHEGYPLKGREKNIVINGTEISIDRQGGITVDGVQVDALKIVDVKDYSTLKKVGENLFECTDKGNEKVAEEYEIQHRSLELSNINIVQEMVKMIDVMRLYESYQKVIQSLDEATGKATREVGAVA